MIFLFFRAVGITVPPVPREGGDCCGVLCAVVLVLANAKLDWCEPASIQIRVRPIKRRRTRWTAWALTGVRCTQRRLDTLRSTSTRLCEAKSTPEGCDPSHPMWDACVDVYVCISSYAAYTCRYAYLTGLKADVAVQWIDMRTCACPSWGSSYC